MSEPVTPKPGSSMARVADAAAALGLDIELKTMDQSTRTADDAARACGCDVAQIVKSLVFEDARTDALAILLVSGAHNADLDFIADTYGLKLKRCDGKRVRQLTGFAIGGVAPIGHLTPTPVHMDETLLGFDTVWAAAGRPDSVFSVDPNALAEAIGAETITVRPTG